MEKTKKLVGITCNIYKLEKFKKELSEKGFTDFVVKPFKVREDLAIIQVSCFESDYPAIAKICGEVEKYFKVMKN